MFSSYTEGIEVDKIDDHMNRLLEFLNNEMPNNEMEAFIKSQIAHFYFVYIHPYLDVNVHLNMNIVLLDYLYLYLDDLKYSYIRGIN